MQIQESITVNASPDKVWALVSDPRNAPRFNRMVQEVTDVREQQRGVGTSWRAIAQMAGRMEIANEITEWEPPRRLAIRMDGPASGTLSFTLTPQGDGSTVVEQQATSDLPAITAPLVRPMLEQNLKESLQRIKETVEQG
ncbi:MAG: SRPBCC family protein [Bacillota bacterium]